MADLQEIMDISLEIGGMMLESNSEIARCENVISHILNTADVTDINIFTLSTVIYLTASKDNNTITRIKRIYHTQTNLEKISAINQLSRDIVSFGFDDQQIQRRIEEIKQIKDPSMLLKVVTIALSCCAFGYMFHPDIKLTESILILLITIMMFVFDHAIKKQPMNFFIATLLNSMFMTILIAIVNLLLNIRFDYVIVGTIMYLVPGVALTNCVRDMLNGDILSGTVRMVECLFIGLAIAFGVFTVLILASLRGIDL